MNNWLLSSAGWDYRAPYEECCRQSRSVCEMILESADCLGVAASTWDSPTPYQSGSTALGSCLSAEIPHYEPYGCRREHPSTEVRQRRPCAEQRDAWCRGEEDSQHVLLICAFALLVAAREPATGAWLVSKWPINLYRGFTPLHRPRTHTSNGPNTMDTARLLSL